MPTLPLSNFRKLCILCQFGPFCKQDNNYENSFTDQMLTAHQSSDQVYKAPPATSTCNIGKSQGDIRCLLEFPFSPPKTSFSPWLYAKTDLSAVTVAVHLTPLNRSSLAWGPSCWSSHMAPTVLYTCGTYILFHSFSGLSGARDHVS